MNKHDSNKKCIHKYLTVCKTNPQPPGFGDFIRGSIALYELAKEYGYTLYIDNSHPLFSNLQESPYLIDGNTFHPYYDTIEMIPPMDYDNIYASLISRFQSGESISLLTNAFYKEITEDCKIFFKSWLKPSLQIHETHTKLLGDTKYSVIHLRFGDRFIHNNEYDSSLYETYYKRITTLIDNSETTFVLLSDSSQIANKLHESIPTLKYWDSNKIHLGDLCSYTGSNNTYDTMVDFFILTKADKIFSNGSGFSCYTAFIFNIPYEGI